MKKLPIQNTPDEQLSELEILLKQAKKTRVVFCTHELGSNPDSLKLVYYFEGLVEAALALEKISPVTVPPTDRKLVFALIARARNKLNRIVPGYVI